MSNTYKDKSDDTSKSSCAAVFYDEFQPIQPWFKCKEPSTQQVLDIPKSFGPNSKLDILLKVLACGYIASTQVLALIQTDDIRFFWAYFTVVALALATIYSVTSLFNSLLPPSQPDGGIVQTRVKFTWTIGVLSVFCEALATVIFWFLVYEWGDTVEYLDISMHGIVFIVVAMEAFVVNRIPLRWMHLWMCWALVLAYVIWSVIQGPLVLDMGNPNEEDNDPSTNDDAIYESLSWDDDDIWSTVILLAIVYFAIVPVVFGILRSFSVWRWRCGSFGDRRRYIRTSLDRPESEVEQQVVDEPSLADVDIYKDETETRPKDYSVE
ncbi:hypothetical protein ACA910_015494 [Epithemia clementina (nom. ined.)]